MMLINYDATEMTSFKGQEFIIEKEESGWVWIISKNGKKGWIPLENIEFIN
ncbi:MAG: SH3 domain-containing protein [Candidatus Thorarchaeota archaeon]